MQRENTLFLCIAYQKLISRKMKLKTFSFLKRWYTELRIYGWIKGGETVEEEQKWIRDIQRWGSRQAADKLVRAYYDEMYRFAYRQLGHKEDALDLTQSIFLAVLRALPSFDGRKASFRTWLYRIATHKAIDCRRKVQGNVLPLEETETPDHTDFAAQIQDRDLLNRLEAYVAQMDPDTQAVYRLRLYGERTFPEIAAILGWPEAAVKTRYYRLMAQLRKEFGSYGALE